MLGWSLYFKGFPENIRKTFGCVSLWSMTRLNTVLTTVTTSPDLGGRPVIGCLSRAPFITGFIPFYVASGRPGVVPV